MPSLTMGERMGKSIQIRIIAKEKVPGQTDRNSQASIKPALSHRGRMQAQCFTSGLRKGLCPNEDSLLRYT